MSIRRTGDLKLIQELNRSIILDTIRKHGPLSRSEIAKRNKLSPTTVTTAIQELIKEDLVCEGEPTASNGGRKPIPVSFSPNGRFIIGISITNSVVTIGQLNLVPEVQKKKCYKVENKLGEHFIDFLLTIIEHFLDQLSSMEKCLGISIIAPGVLNFEQGIILYSSKLNLVDIPLKSIIEKRFGLKTWLDSDTNAVALAEKEIGAFQAYENILNIIVGDGVGAGIVFNDSIFRGHQGGAGELGHTIVEIGGIPCECGNQGCLENYISWPAILNQLKTKLLNGESSMLEELLNDDFSNLTIDLIDQAYRHYDPLVVQVIDQTILYFVTALANLVNLFNPDLIILGGVFFHNNPSLVQKIRQLVLEKGINTNTKHLNITSSSLGQDFELLAAANIVLHNEFSFSFNQLDGL
ncbi:MAG TPA: ROK family transcriptional regulator [Sporolactobacillaceae bacterium]|nr:ROK family transcriptional regulator [Sporolactobacillaceae bacterium]